MILQKKREGKASMEFFDFIMGKPSKTGERQTSGTDIAQHADFQATEKSN